MRMVMIFLAWVVVVLNMYLLITVDWIKCIFKKGKSMSFVIYGKPTCVYCTKAKQLLDKHNRAYIYREVGGQTTKEQLEILVGTPVKTVPQIFVSEDGISQYIGGYTDLVEYLKTTLLKKETSTLLEG